MNHEQANDLESRRNKRTGRFTHATHAEQKVTLLALSRSGNPISSRTAAPNRKYTHVVVQDDETYDAVHNRYSRIIQEATHRLELLEHGLANPPRVGKNIETRQVRILPPPSLSGVIKPVFSTDSHAEIATREYLAQIENEIQATETTMMQAHEILDSLENGTYEYRKAQVLRWATSFQLARKLLSRELAEDKHNRRRLYISTVIESDPDDPSSLAAASTGDFSPILVSQRHLTGRGSNLLPHVD